jgi:hypothetical protein
LPQAQAMQHFFYKSQRHREATANGSNSPKVHHRED